MCGIGAVSRSGFFVIEQFMQLVQRFTARCCKPRLFLFFLAVHFDQGNGVGNLIAGHCFFHHCVTRGITEGHIAPA